MITWLERGDCNKRNANTFYSMIQSTNSHIRRLLSEKTQYEEELQKAREIMKGRMQGILLQCKYLTVVLFYVVLVNTVQVSCQGWLLDGAAQQMLRDRIRLAQSYEFVLY